MSVAGLVDGVHVHGHTDIVQRYQGQAGRCFFDLAVVAGAGRKWAILVQIKGIITGDTQGLLPGYSPDTPYLLPIPGTFEGGDTPLPRLGVSH